MIKLTDWKLHRQDADCDGREGQDEAVGTTTRVCDGYVQVAEVCRLAVGEDVFVMVEGGLEEEDVVVHVGKVYGLV
jgi:hypothetical protein